MELPDPTTPKPDETIGRSYSRWTPTISNDSDWNKMNSRRNPDRAIVLKGQSSQKVLYQTRRFMAMSEADILSHIESFEGNNWGFKENLSAINFIVELYEAGTVYLVCMSNDGQPSGSWSHSNSPYRAYNRAPTSDDTEWYYNQYLSRTPVEKMWQNRANYAAVLTEYDWYKIQTAAKAKSAALTTDEVAATTKRANDALTAATEKITHRCLALGAVNLTAQGTAALMDSLFNIWKTTEANADEAHRAAHDEAWARYETIMKRMGFEA